MVKVEIRCHSCGAAVSRELNYTEGKDFWGWRLWKSALTYGWVRRLDDNAPFCTTCKSQLDAPSTIVLPINPLSINGYIECNSCSARHEKGEVLVDEYFARNLRRNAASQGWRFISVDGNQTYQDYCPKCEPDELGKRREFLMKLVWSKPTLKVAREMGISDKAIEKRCKRLGIPKPPVGFWAKYHAGYINECITLIPEIVLNTLGEDFIEEIYGLDQNRSQNTLIDL